MRCSSRIAVLTLSALSTAAPTAKPQGGRGSEIQPGPVRRASGFWDPYSNAHVPESILIASTNIPEQQHDTPPEPIIITTERSVEDIPNKPRADEESLLNTFIAENWEAKRTTREEVTQDLIFASSNLEKRSTLIWKRRPRTRKEGQHDVVHEHISRLSSPEYLNGKSDVLHDGSWDSVHGRRRVEGRGSRAAPSQFSTRPEVEPFAKRPDRGARARIVDAGQVSWGWVQGRGEGPERRDAVRGRGW